MSDIIKRKNKKKTKTILKRFLKLSRSSSFNSHEVIAQEAGAVANAVWETFLLTKKQQLSWPQGGEIKPTIHMGM